MLEYLPYEEMLLKGEEYEKKGLKPFYYAKDINIKGKKLYGVCESFDDFWKKYELLNESKKNFNELIKTANPRRQLFDIDCKKELLTTKQQKWLDDDSDLLTTFQEAFNNFYQDHYGERFEGEELEGEFYTTTSTSASKFSLHITTNYCFESFDAQEVFMKKFEDYLEKNPDLELQNIHGDSVVDFAINSRNRVMRILNSSKFGEDRPLKILESDQPSLITKYFASVIDEDCVFCKVPESWFKKKTDYIHA